jgi:hypothetical protein
LGGSRFEASLGKKVPESPSTNSWVQWYLSSQASLGKKGETPLSPNNHSIKCWRGQAVGCLPHKFKTLSSNSSTTKKSLLQWRRTVTVIFILYNQPIENSRGKRIYKN